MAVFVYLLLIILLSFGAWLALRIKIKAVSTLGKVVFSVALFLLLFEFGAALVFYMISGKWFYSMQQNRNSELFEPHPYLVGTNRKNINKQFNGYNFSHNSRGYRDGEIGDKADGEIRIAAIGGSTTYGVGVNDKETWPYYLDSLLGSRYTVINMGVPGHSTVEHIITAAFQLPELNVDAVVIHAGLNDLRNSYVVDLEPDYANFHAPTIYESLGFCYREKLPLLASVRMTVRMLQNIGWYPICMAHRKKYYGKTENGIDHHVLALYERNLRTLTGVIQNQDIKVYMLPQVLIAENFRDNYYQWWAPYIPDSAIKATCDTFNRTMEKVAINNGLPFASVLEKEEWSVNDFSDPSHLNKAGNLKFASIVAGMILNADTIHE